LSPNRRHNHHAHPLQRNRVRFLLVGLALVLLGLAMVGKLFALQTLDAQTLQRKAQQSRNQSVSLYKRGRIFDRNGVILAQDSFLYDLYAHPKYYWGVSPKVMARTLAPLLGLPEATLAQTMAQPMPTIRLARNLSHEVVQKIRDAKILVPKTDRHTLQPLHDEQGQLVMAQQAIPGLDFAKKTVRNYPQGSLAAHVLGYVNDEAGISTGIEAAAAKALKAESLSAMATQNLMHNGRGDWVNLDQIPTEAMVASPNAKDVQLTLDARLQYIAERELEKGLARTHAKRGAVVILDPATSEVLAFAVLPSFTPDKFFQADPESLKNWAITDVYPPGSTFKVLTVASGLESGVITADTKIEDTGKMKLGHWTITNYDYRKRPYPGMISLVDLLEHSSNVGSAKIALKIPVEEHQALLRRFGIGQKTGVEIPGESSGILQASQAWDMTTHATIGYGYGIASTPLQMAAAVGAIANGGLWRRPHVLKVDVANLPARRVISAKTAATVRDLMAQSIRQQRTSTVRLEGVDVAGKTGTSRKPSANGKGYSNELFTSFVGFFPAQTPKALVVIVIDSPQMAESWGSTVAGPIFKGIADQMLPYLGLRPALKTTHTHAQVSVPAQLVSDHG
jgi:cell division protein FtsI (penicillin-binding protein 3)